MSCNGSASTLSRNTYMATLIKDKRIAPDPWQLLQLPQLLKPAADGGATGAPQSGDWIVPLAVWAEQRATLVTRQGRNGVLLENTDDPRALAADFDKLAVIAVRFPKFTDGRGYSIARLLRRLGWQGELRAVGDVQRDELFYMSRCGFDAFELREGQNAENALTAFNDFSMPYQAAIDNGSRFGGAPAAGNAAINAISPW